MADFQPIPINGTAEQLEKILAMDIVESVTENSTDDQIPTARAVKDAIASGTGGTAEGAVLYTTQNLTPQQQIQARDNILAASKYGVANDFSMYGHDIVDVKELRFAPPGDSDIAVGMHLSDDETYSVVSFSSALGDVILRSVADGTQDNDAATVGQLNAAVNGLENTANRVTTIDETADDEHYPTAKAVYDAISGIEPGDGTGGNSGSDYKGNVIELGYTSFSQCTEYGYYSFKYDDIEKISDAPEEINRGGWVMVFPNVASNQSAQILCSISENNGNTWYFRHGENAFENIDPEVYQYTGTSTIGTMSQNAITIALKNRFMFDGDFSGTKFSDYANFGYRRFPSSQVASISDAPEGLKAGNLYNFPSSGGWNKFQFLSDINGNVWFRYGENPFKQINEPMLGVTRWLTMGDSITEGWYGYVNNGTPTCAVASETNRWVNQVALLNKFTLTNIGVGGSGYVTNGGVSTRKNARQLADETDYSNYDLVTLAYGVNDWKYDATLGSMEDDVTTGGTIYSNMRYVIEKILSDKPLCKIIVITPLNCSMYGTEESNWGLGHSFPNNGTLEEIFAAEKEICEHYGIEYIDMTHSSVVNRKNINSVLPDGVHPSIDCHKVIAKELAKKINFI